MSDVAPLQINAGGLAASPFVADEDYSGGSLDSSVTASIDTSGVADAAPQAVYQSQHYGDSFTYTISGLNPSTAYTLRLDFAEVYYGAPGTGGSSGGAGSRVFDVSAQGSAILTNFDIYSTAGAANKAVEENFTVTSDFSGVLTVAFTGVTNGATVSGVEVLPQASPTATPADTATPGTSGSDPCPLSPDNVGTSVDNHTSNIASFDHSGFSYLDTRLEGAGFPSGGTFSAGGVAWTLPSWGTYSPDNMIVNGQTICAGKQGSTLGFLGASEAGGASGSGTITYADSSTQSFTLGLDDWAAGSLSESDTQAGTTMCCRNNSSGTPDSVNVKLYYVTVSLDPGKAITSVALPSSFTGSGRMHLFAVAVAGSGVSASPTPGAGTATPGPPTATTVMTTTTVMTGGVHLLLSNGQDASDFMGSIAEQIIGFASFLIGFVFVLILPLGRTPKRPL